MIASVTAASPVLELLPWAIGIGLAIVTLFGGWLLRRPAAADQSDGDQTPDFDATENGIFGPLTQPLARMLPDVLQGKSRRDMLRCGYYHPAAYDSYLALRNGLVVGTVLSAACWVTAVADEPELVNIVLVVGVVAALLAYSLPRL